MPPLCRYSNLEYYRGDPTSFHKSRASRQTSLTSLGAKEVDLAFASTEDVVAEALKAAAPIAKKDARGSAHATGVHIPYQDKVENPNRAKRAKIGRTDRQGNGTVGEDLICGYDVTHFELYGTNCNNEEMPIGSGSDHFDCFWQRDGELILRPGGRYRMTWNHRNSYSTRVKLKMYEEDTMSDDFCSDVTGEFNEADNERIITLPEWTDSGMVSCASSDGVGGG